MKTLSTASIATMIGLASLVAASYSYANDRMTGRGTGPTIYVPEQGLFYDSIALADLPQQGDFQELEMAGPTGLQTKYGLGDVGYLGGRWWLDVNENDMMDGEDEYFLCPLLGPGRTTIN